MDARGILPVVVTHTVLRIALVRVFMHVLLIEIMGAIV